MSKKTIIYIIRHGESEANTQGLVGHNPESRLTTNGRKQIDIIVKKLAHIHLDKIISSDFTRALQTAEILSQNRSLKIIVAKELRERSYGRLNGKTFSMIKSELQGKYDYYEKLPEKLKFIFKLVDDMETVKDALDRFSSYLQKITIEHEGETLLLVCHGTLMRALLKKYGLLKYDESSSKIVQNGSYFKIENDDTRFHITEEFKIRKE